MQPWPIYSSEDIKLQSAGEALQVDSAWQVKSICRSSNTLYLKVIWCWTTTNIKILSTY